MSQYDDLEDEEELRESYPHLYGAEEEPYVPLRGQLEPKYQKILDTERAKLREQLEVVEEHGENYHYTDKITDEMLPTVNFRRYDNLFLAKPANAFLRPAEGKPKSERRLFGDFWLEGEMTVLFGETGCGKSLLAMQIARALAGGPHFEPFEMDVEPGRVGYFDFDWTRFSSGDDTPLSFRLLTRKILFLTALSSVQLRCFAHCLPALTTFMISLSIRSHRSSMFTTPSSSS